MNNITDSDVVAPEGRLLIEEKAYGFGRIVASGMHDIYPGDFAVFHQTGEKVTINNTPYHSLAPNDVRYTIRYFNLPAMPKPDPGRVFISLIKPQPEKSVYRVIAVGPNSKYELNQRVLMSGPAGVASGWAIHYHNDIAFNDVLESYLEPETP